MSARQALGIFGFVVGLLVPASVKLGMMHSQRLGVLGNVLVVPLIVPEQQPSALTDEEVLTMAQQGTPEVRVMAVELISYRGLGTKVWGYSSAPRGLPADWWDYRDALDEGDSVAAENGWEQLWLVEALMTEDGNVYPTGARERIR